MKGYAASRPIGCSKGFATASLRPVCRWRALSPAAAHCTRNGRDTPIFGIATAARSHPSSGNAARLTSRRSPTAPLPSLSSRHRPPPRKALGRVCAGVSPAPMRSSIFPVSRGSPRLVIRTISQGSSPSRGQGIGYSCATDRLEGFHDNDLVLIQAVLPAVSLAIMSDAAHIIASGLLAAYLGEDAGRRVHAGAVERGSVESIRAVLWYADIRGFTSIADRWPGLAVIELLDEVFESLAAPLRRRGGQVLKFLGGRLL